MQWDVLVAGAGAAGLMCAVEAGKRGRRVAVLEHNAEIGRKILISGGGRCNFTNIHTSPANYLSANPHFGKSALARYRPADFIALVEKHRIPYHEKTLGQLFCDRDARDITTMLRRECDLAGVRIYTGCAIGEVRKPAEFVLETSRGEFRAPALVVATGGLSIPKIGASDFGYRVAKQFRLRLQPCRPALVPLTLGPEDRARWCGLSGVSAEVEARAGNRRFRGKMLITHRGLSGPAILQISSHWEPGTQITVEFAPGTDLDVALLARRRETVELKTALAAFVPRRLAEILAGASRPLNTYSVPELAAVAENVKTWLVTPAGTEGYAKAEVTAGGVDTAELSSKTFQSLRVAGLYFIGEVLDVTGHLGGYNFQWAWASGYCAGQYV